jgi:hypothetical protein
MTTAAPSALKIKCSRCGGKGYLNGMQVVYAGAPGGCFKCAGSGEVYKDKFYRAFGVGRKFFGITLERYLNPGNPNNGVFKMLATKLPDLIGEQRDFRGRLTERLAAVEITEAQARQFWGRYGELTQLGGVRVADFDGSVQ